MSLFGYVGIPVEELEYYKARDEAYEELVKEYREYRAERYEEVLSLKRDIAILKDVLKNFLDGGSEE